MQFSKESESRIIEMAWEDRTPFEAIELQFGLNESKVIQFMRSHLKLGSFKLWRSRVTGRTTKHLNCVTLISLEGIALLSTNIDKNHKR